jgi:hypothetical protein
MQVKNQYLQAKLKQNGGISVPSRDSFLLTESFDNLMNNSQ